MTGAQGWAAVGVIVAAVDLAAIRRGHPELTMSAACDRARARHPALNALVLGGIACTALHLARALGPADPFRLIGLAR